MQTLIQWQGGAAFTADTASGHRLLLDGPPEHGGENKGARPMEMFLSAAAACSAFDVMHILKKGKQPLQALTVQASGERAASEPKVYTRICLHFHIVGKVKDAAAARAVQLSVEKYCSALAMLAATCEITHSYQITAADDPATSPAAAAGE